MVKFIIGILLLASTKAEEPKPTIESLQTEIVRLKEQLSQSQRQYQIGMGVCNSALAAATGLILVPQHSNIK